MLEFYASRMNSVEIDSTFYRMPQATVMETWRGAVPEDFRFAIKASRRISHRERLAVPSEALTYFLDVVSRLTDRLGLMLFQLPPFFKVDAGRLAAFLSAIPAGTPVAFEFRHDSWFNDETYSLLEKHNAALCIHDADEGVSPLRLTAKVTYVRLRRSQYSEELRREWQDRFRAWRASGTDVFAYIKHKDNPDAPRIAMEFASGL
jgi:uncharacterized protein YecE (DUF72 family)